MIKKIIKEPLVHFLTAGFFLFVIYSWINPSNSNDENTIVVNKEKLLNVMQYRSKAFNKSVFESKFETMTAAKKQELIDNVIKEEVLYREALKMGLDANDYIIKSRLIQKVDFIYSNTLNDNFEPHKDSVQAYFKKYSARYKTPEQLTFTHVFYPFKKDSTSVLKKANSFMNLANKKKFSFNEANTYGEPFLYHKNYIDRDWNFITSHFGKAFSHSLRILKAGNEWQGPIVSKYGYHVVLLTKNIPSKTQDLEQVKTTVIDDYKTDFLVTKKNKRIQKTVANYNVIVDLDTE